MRDPSEREAFALYQHSVLVVCANIPKPFCPPLNKICSVINLFRVSGSAGGVVFTSRQEPDPSSTPAAQNARREEDSVRKPLKFHFFDKGVEYRAI